MQKSLLLGCGNSREKKVYLSGQEKWAGELVTVDINPDCGASLVFNIGARLRHVGVVRGVLPFEDEEFDEIGAFDCLEHWGEQGDFRQWFGEMAEYHRIIKPGGTMGIMVPIGADALADPGHTRFFHRNHFNFLCQAFYEQNTEKRTCFTDYRWLWKLNFDILFMEQQGDHHLAVLLRKPA